MTESAEPPPAQRGGRILMLGSVVLAVGAAVALALGSEDAGLLRLGIVAALWAALLGTFAAVRSLREAGAEHPDSIRKAYQLELDREIAARREHELTVEREIRERIERQEREEIAALRGELQALRETLRNLLGGDVLVERVALRAESTRLLPIPDHSRTVADDHPRIPAVDAVVGTPQRPASRPRSLSPEPATRQAATRQAATRPSGTHPSGTRQPEPIEVASVSPAQQSSPDSRPAPGQHERPAPGQHGKPQHGGLESDIFARPAANRAGGAGPADRAWRPAVSSVPSSGPSSTPSWEPAVSFHPGVGGQNRPSRRHAEPHLPDPDSAGTRSGNSGGRHSRPSGPRYPAPPPPSVRPSPSAHRGPGSGPSGAQQSVDDLLAAHGQGAVPRHRRRRSGD